MTILSQLHQHTTDQTPNFLAMIARELEQRADRGRRDALHGRHAAIHADDAACRVRKGCAARCSAHALCEQIVKRCRTRTRGGTRIGQPASRDHQPDARCPQCPQLRAAVHLANDTLQKSCSQAKFSALARPTAPPNRVPALELRVWSSLIAALPAGSSSWPVFREATIGCAWCRAR